MKYELFKITKLFNIAFILCITFSCGKATDERLIEFRNFNANNFRDVDEKLFAKLEKSSFDSDSDTVDYRNGEIYISYLSVVNSCSNRKGDIEFKNDLLFLKMYCNDESVNSELSCHRLIYRIKNPSNRKYQIIKVRG